MEVELGPSSTSDNELSREPATVINGISTCKDLELEHEASSSSVYDIPGEPATVINGMPNVILGDSSALIHDTESDGVSEGNVGFGEWLEGREVRKLFGEQFYSGKVKKYDSGTGWYRVLYEDGDSEDLEWCELEGILLPLEITLPLKALALKILRKNEKYIHRKAETASTSRKSRGVESKENREGDSSMKFQCLNSRTQRTQT